MLFTKLNIPKLNDNLVHRSNLLEKLDDGLKKKLILVSATAGYGKTTLICDWIKQKNVSTAWFSIDVSDNDPVEFLTCVLSSIQKTNKDIGKNSLELLKSSGSIEIDYIIESFINDLLFVKEDLLIVFDDLHLINNQQIFDLLSLLIDHTPLKIHLALLSRQDPTIPLARLRSQNQIVEIRSSDLSFTGNDITFFFNKKLKIDLKEDDVKNLESRTEGWVAGLQLAALSLSGKEDISGFIKNLTVDNRYIMDYLMEEILNNIDDEVKMFLLKTSIFEKLSASLCNAVLEISNSQLILENLEKQNMFIIPLDDERKWFRYHHLFADLLKKSLLREYNDIIPSLHQNASNWFEKDDLSLFAIEHALKAGDKKKSLELIESIVDHLMETSQYSTILKFAKLFNEQDLISTEKFGIIYAWTLTIAGRAEEAEIYLGKLEERIVNKYKRDETKKYLARVYLIFNLINTYKGESEDAFKYSQLALKYIDDEDLVWKSFTYYLNSNTLILRFELERSMDSLFVAWNCAKELNNFYLKIVNPSQIAFLLKLKGQYSEALKICNELLKEFDSNNTGEEFKLNLFSAVIYLTKGSILTEQGKTEEGLQLALKGYDLSQKLVGISFKGYGALILAETYFKIGKLDKALDIIEKLEAYLVKNENHWLFVIIKALKFKILTQKDIERADKIYNQFINHKNIFQSIFFNIARVRYLLYKKKHEEANLLIDKLSMELERAKAYELWVEIKIMQSKALLKRNRIDSAKEVLVETILKTQSEMFVRSYVNEGVEIETILKEIKREKATTTSKLLDEISNEYVNKILKEFEKERKTQSIIEDESLTKRELETLRLIAQDYSNQDIADELFISLNTVKTHVKNILLKLEVKNRAESVIKAKELKIL